MLRLIVLGWMMGSSGLANDLAWAQSLTQKSMEGIEKYKLDAQAIVRSSQETMKKCLIQQPSNPSGQGTPSANKPKESITSDLRVFVSFSMPDAVLQSLAREVAARGGKSVFRGLFESSFRKTAEKLKTLQVDALIDPVAFRDHHITAVPTFVQGSHRLTGNVSISYVMDQFRGENR